MTRTIKNEFTGDRGYFFDSSVQNAKMKSKRYNDGLKHSRKSDPVRYLLHQRKKIAETLWDL